MVLGTDTSIGLLAFFVFLTIMFACYALFAPVVNTKRKEIGTEVFSLTEVDIDPDDSLGKYVRPVLDNIMPQLPINLSDDRKSKLAKIIRTSGNPWRITPEELIALQVGLGILGVLVGTIIAIMPGIPESIPRIIFPVFLGIAGVALPFSKYNSLKEERTKQIEKQLPEAIDLITITVETAGDTFESGLRSVTNHMQDNLLRSEFIKIITEIDAGQNTRDALTSFYRRFDSKDLEAFCKALIQSKELGNDPTRTLKQQSNFIRANYEARIERMIARLETTMFIPLIGTMLPAFLIVLIGPQIAQLSQYLG